MSEGRKKSSLKTDTDISNVIMLTGEEIWLFGKDENQPEHISGSV